MAKYTQHLTDDGKFTCPSCDYGSAPGEGKTRQSVSRHFNANHTDAPPKVDVRNDAKTAEPEPEPEPVDPEPVEPIANVPEWLDVAFDEESGDKVVASIPGPVKGLLQTLSRQVDPETVRSPQEVRDWFRQQARLVRYFLAGVIDPLVNWYGKGVTLDPEFKISRSPDEWELTEAVTEQWLEYRGLSFMVNPDVLMAGTLAALYIPPIVGIQRDRDPAAPRWSPRGWFQRWRMRRALNKAVKENPHNEGREKEDRDETER